MSNGLIYLKVLQDLQAEDESAVTGERNGPLLPWKEKCAENRMGDHPGKGFGKYVPDTEKNPPQGAGRCGCQSGVETWVSAPDLRWAFYHTRKTSKGTRGN